VVLDVLTGAAVVYVVLDVLTGAPAFLLDTIPLLLPDVYWVLDVLTTPPVLPDEYWVLEVLTGAAS